MPKQSWTDYRKKWSACTRCHLHETATEHVLYRGDRPAQVLFIGEAPGPDEDLVGEPFIGPAGRLLDTCIAAARDRLSEASGDDYRDLGDFTFGIANILCCFPVKDPAKQDRRGNFRAPTPGEAEACQPHLLELLPFVKPIAVISLGLATDKLVPKSLKRSNDFEYTKVTHPSYWMRTGGVKGLEYKKALYTITDFIQAQLTKE